MSNINEIAEITNHNKIWSYSPNDKTYVRNITNIDISVILENTIGKRGEILIPSKQARPISNEEIIIKIEAQNPSFCGTDGFGKNASLFIEDEGFRKHLGFETSSEKQMILSDTVLENIFNAKSISAFKKLIEKSIETYAEKDSLISYLREKFNAGEFDSTSKIDFVEQYTGLKIRE